MRYELKLGRRQSHGNRSKTVAYACVYDYTNAKNNIHDISIFITYPYLIRKMLYIFYKIWEYFCAMLPAPQRQDSYITFRAASHQSFNTAALSKNQDRAEIVDIGTRRAAYDQIPQRTEKSVAVIVVQQCAGA